MRFPCDGHPFVLRLVIINRTGNIPPPRNRFSCFFITDRTIPLCYFLPGKTRSPGHVSIRDTTICSIPKGILTIRARTKLCLSFRKDRKSGRNHTGQSGRNSQSILFRQFGSDQNSTVFTPRTIQSSGGSSLQNINTFYIFGRYVKKIRLHRHTVNHHQRSLST